MNALHKNVDDWLLGKKNRIIKPKQGGGFSWHAYGSSGGGRKKPLKQGFGIKNLTAAAQNKPEVMVKIPQRHGSSNGLKGIKNNLDYISRNGELDLEDNNGNIISGKSEINDLLLEYEMLGIEEESKYKEAINVVLSMPPNTDPVALKNAVREFAKETFPDNRWVMVQHLDTDHPHCHLNVLMRDKFGIRLNPRKNDLYEWRLRFAEKLREHGIECAATRRQHRGKYQKAQSGIVRHIRDRGGYSTVLAQQAMELAKAIKEEKRPTSPFLQKQLETQKIIVEEYGALAKELFKLGYKKEARLISLLRKQVEDGDLSTSAQQEYDKAMANRNIQPNIQTTSEIPQPNNQPNLSGSPEQHGLGDDNMEIDR